jgi:glycosyltransferase involved in cell wall biosynthesis
MRSLNNKIFAAGRLVHNAFTTSDVWYIVESANWATRQVGGAISTELNRQRLTRTTLTVSPWHVNRGLVHYGSLPTFFAGSQPRLSKLTTRRILTIFHLASNKHSLQAQLAARSVELIHTSSTITKSALMELGIPEEKIIVIPLGVDLNIFKSVTAQTRQQVRRILNLPPAVTVIGSFQKDGRGWAAGTMPKLEKGPDILVDTLSHLSHRKKIHVLLAGPARGYVIKQLIARRIPHTYVGYHKSLTSIAPLYQAIDAYLITSRSEGGPLSLLEARASGVPVISTPVGMATDISDPQIFVSQSFVSAELSELLLKAVTSAGKNSPDIQQYSWSVIARRYYEELYRKVYSLSNSNSFKPGRE